MNYLFLLKPVTYIFALLSGTWLVLYVEKLKPSDLHPYDGLFKKEIYITKQDTYPLKPVKISLGEHEIAQAKIAWKYFEKHLHPSGLIPDANNSPEFTISAQGDYLWAISSAFECGIIDSAVFTERTSDLLKAVRELELNKTGLPYFNYYSTGTLLTAGREGHSAEDISRFLSACLKISTSYPFLATKVNKTISGWNVGKLVKDNEIMDAARDYQLVQSTRLGYEQYYAKCLMRLGLDVGGLLDYREFIRFKEINGQEIAFDPRETEGKHNANYVMAEPYLLDGFENGWDSNSRELAYRIFQAEKNKAAVDGKIFLSGSYRTRKFGKTYNAVYVNKETWQVISRKGKIATENAVIPTATAFSYYILYDDTFSESVFSATGACYHPDKGWYEGYPVEKSIITAKTNTIILEALAYKKNGKLIDPLKPVSQSNSKVNSKTQIP